MSRKVAVSVFVAAGAAVVLLGAIAYAWSTPKTFADRQRTSPGARGHEVAAPEVRAPRGEPPAVRSDALRVLGSDRADEESASAFDLRQAMAPELEIWVRESHVTEDQLAAFYVIQRDMYEQARLVEHDATAGQIRGELSEEEARKLLSLADVEREFDRRLAQVLSPAQIDGLLARVRSYYLLTVLRLSE